MATITRRIIKGRSYYYAVRSARVNGKPRLVWQKYLGTADDLVRMHEDAGKPQQPEGVRLFRFGAEAAQLHVAHTLDIVDLIDKVVPKREQGLSVGTYLLIAAINRGCCPTSKRALGDWFFGSMLTHRFPEVTPADLLSQRFWDHMSKMAVERLPKIEEEIAKQVIQVYGVDMRVVIYDTTNFFTFIDTFNRRCKLAQRGKNKQKRFDLRQVSMALLVTREDHVPLFHRCYEGNRVDSDSFQSLVDDLVERVKAVDKGCAEVTVVFDKGNNSQEAIEKLEASEYHFVGSLVPSYVPDLLEVSKERYRPLTGERFSGMTAYREQRPVFGVTRTVVVVFSERFFTKQLKTVLLMREKAQGKLRELQGRLQGWEDGLHTKGRAPTLDSVRKQVADILKGQYMKDLLPVSVTRGRNAPALSCQMNQNRLDELTRTVFGKTILFTDRDNWRTEEIVGAFFDKGEVEEAFKRMKDREFSSWFPMFHWTDQKIKVHAFSCVLALLFTSLLYREANNAGITISQRKLMEKLSNIHQVLSIYPSPGNGRKPPSPQMMLSERDPIQQKLCALLDLERYQ